MRITTPIALRARTGSMSVEEKEKIAKEHLREHPVGLVTPKHKEKENVRHKEGVYRKGTPASPIPTPITMEDAIDLQRLQHGKVEKGSIAAK